MMKSNADDFQWVQSTTSAEESKGQYYESCLVGNILISRQDFVLINNYDDPDNENTAYIAKLLKLFESDCKRDAPHRALVSWYARIHELPTHLRKKLSSSSTTSLSCSSSSSASDPEEILLNSMNFEKNIDVETVIKKIYVKEVQTGTLLNTNNINYSYIFKGRVYDGKKITDDRNKKNQNNNNNNDDDNEDDDGFNLKSRSGRKLKKVVMDLSPDVSVQKSRRASVAVVSENLRKSCKKSLFSNNNNTTTATSATTTRTTATINGSSSSSSNNNTTSTTTNTTNSTTKRGANTPSKKLQIQSAKRKSLPNLSTRLACRSSVVKSKIKSKFQDDSEDGDDCNEDDNSDYNDDDDDDEINDEDLIESSSSSSDGDDDDRNVRHTKRRFTKLKVNRNKRKSGKINANDDLDNDNDYLNSYKMSSLTSSLSSTMTTSTSGIKSSLQLIRERLHLAAIPDVLPCREEEFADIYQFVRSKIVDKTGGCMYISGVPGTGKTATVRQVMCALNEESKCGDLIKFKYIEINGMRLVDPHHANIEILKQLTGQKATAEHACNLLTRRFKTEDPHRVPLVLLVDELDLLWTRKQTVMYNLFDWPTYKPSQLVVIAIANTMDLPERMMMNRVASRLGLTRLTFQPYNHHQLQEIVLSRIKGFNAFDEDAIQLVARKVAALSGDARRALEICRRSTELVGGEDQLVSMVHVDAAIQEMFSAPKMVAVRCASHHEKLFLKALLSEFQRTGIEEAVLVDVFTQLVALCRFESIAPPNLSQVSRICNRLGGFKLLLTDSGRNDIHQKIRLNISQDDLSYALKDNHLST